MLFAGLAFGCAKSVDQADGGKSGAGGGSGTAGGGTGGTSGAGGSGAECTPECGEGRVCCSDRCVNLQNDPKNCGSCGEVCGADTYCGAGDCVAPPCLTMCGMGSPGSICCGTQCCAAGQLCCDPQGPLDDGPRCADPDAHGSCAPGCAPLCICADPDTPIATPDGSRPIASLSAGDLVYSVDRGEVVVVAIVRTQRTPVVDHHVMRVTLQGGAVIEISPGHPTADGRRFEDLRAGEALDGVAIRSVDLIRYEHDATYDILPGSDTGAYFASGVLVGSTLASRPALRTEPTAPLERLDP